MDWHLVLFHHSHWSSLTRDWSIKEWQRLFFPFSTFEDFKELWFFPDWPE